MHSPNLPYSKRVGSPAALLFIGQALSARAHIGQTRIICLIKFPDLVPIMWKISIIFDLSKKHDTFQRVAIGQIARNFFE